MKSLRLITDGQIAADHADLLDQIETLKAQRFRIVPRLNSDGKTAQEIRASQNAEKPDYTIFIGNVPPIFISQPCEPLGYDPIFAHKLYCTAGALALDANNIAQAPPKAADNSYAVPWGAVSVIWYPDAALYPQAMEKLLSWEQTTDRYAPRLLNDDHLAFWITDDWYIQIGNRVRAQVPAALLDDRQELPTTAADGSDGVLAECAEHPVLWLSLLSGGLEDGLFYVGRSADLRRIQPQAAVVSVFGSAQCQFRKGDNLLVAITALPGSYAAVYNYEGRFPFRSFLEGAPLGDASLELSQQARWGSLIYFITDILGDCSMALTTDQMLAALTERVTRIEQGFVPKAPDLSVNAQFSSLLLRIGELESRVDSIASQQGVQESGAVRVNLGGLAVGIFSADSNCTRGLTWSTARDIDTANVVNAAPPDVYKSCRTNIGPDIVQVVASELKGEVYTVRLHFCEPVNSVLGRRPMTVRINDSVVLDGFDPATESGSGFRACVKEFNASPASGSISIKVDGSPAAADRNPLLCAYELLPKEA